MTNCKRGLDLSKLSAEFSRDKKLDFASDAAVQGNCKELQNQCGDNGDSANGSTDQQ